MSLSDLEVLAVLVRKERPKILSRWRQQVREIPSARNLDTPTLNDHIPDLLEDIAAGFMARSGRTIPEALSAGSPPAHGLQRLKDAFDIEEVVAEYNILRGCVHDLAQEHGLSLQGEPFHILNRIFDQAIGQAVQAYANHRALEVQRRREEYLSFVAHDLRTPVNAISLAGRVLEQSLPKQDSSNTHQLLKGLRRNVEQLTRLVNKVLEENNYLQEDGGIRIERRHFDLWPLVEALIQELQPVAQAAGTRLTNRVPDELAIYADAGLLRRVLQNLLANAIHHTANGEVMVTARELDAHDGVECCVSDNGSGIPEALLSRIFEKGETDHQEPGGTGLGLAIVKLFTEAHGGSVNVESREGVGSTFRITVPSTGPVDHPSGNANG